MRSLCLVLLLLLGACDGGAAGTNQKGIAPLRIAVASNFTPTLERIAVGFEQQTGFPVSLSSGSSGKHYAQIHNGAPFDLYFAADADLPLRLEHEGAILAGTRTTYAIGSLALWSQDPDLVDDTGAIPPSDTFRHLAIANPDLAPYGKAAYQTLESLGMWEALQSKLVLGENIGQAFQFTHSGNAQLGFVAWAQLAGQDFPIEGSWWRVPEELHEPLIQQVVQLRDHVQAEAFLDYLESAEARTIIQDSGYRLP
jgi:molybdate transport system substrate-binding protein